MTQHEGVLREEFKVKLWAFIAAWADGHIIDRCNRVVEIESLIENHYRALAERVAVLEQAYKSASTRAEEYRQERLDSVREWEQRLADAQARVKDLEQEQAAIKQAVSREFAKKSYTDEDRKHEDLLENIGVFLNHHQELEQQHDTLTARCETMEKVLQEALKIMPLMIERSWAEASIDTGQATWADVRHLREQATGIESQIKHALSTGGEIGGNNGNAK